MTVSVVMAGLVPILWSTGVGSDIMKPIAAPIIGGMVTSTIHVLIITPVIFYLMKTRALRKRHVEGLTDDAVNSERGGFRSAGIRHRGIGRPDMERATT